MDALDYKMRDAIALALTQAFNEGLERGAFLAECEAWDAQDLDEEKSIVNRTCEEIATAIRKELTTQKERGK
jgi:hypothetical protein